jgi:hypothetical protein
MSAAETQFSADLSAGALLLAESRRIAGLLLRTPTEAEWDHAIRVENILQKTTPSTAVRQARLIRFRLQPLCPQVWTLIADGEREVAVQLLFAAALLHSALLRDFVHTVLVDHPATAPAGSNPPNKASPEAVPPMGDAAVVCRQRFIPNYPRSR